MCAGVVKARLTARATLPNAVSGDQCSAYSSDLHLCRPIAFPLLVPCAGFGDASTDTLHDHCAFELGEHAKHLKHGVACRGASSPRALQC
jgi:hypothetical protein